MARHATAMVALRREVDRLLAPLPGNPRSSGPGRIGVEAEFLVVDECSDRRALVAIERIRQILGSLRGFVEAARPSFEPGGQLELSPAPSASPALAIARLDRLTRAASSQLGRHGIGLLPVGVDMWRSGEDVGLQTPRDRYLVMQRHFDAIGPAGRRMMRQTASLQVCIDRAPGAAGVRQWLAANLVGPALAAAFRTTDGPANRTAIWLAVDPSRTGLDSRQVDVTHPVEAYLRFALDAEVMALPRAGDSPAAPLRTPLEAWIAAGTGRPDADDVAHHLSTLFPPVRPRDGYLELRFLDAQPPGRVGAAIALVAILLGDPLARDAVIEIAGPDPSGLGAAWWRSASEGLNDPALRGQALQLLEVASARVSDVDRRWPGWLPPESRAVLESVMAHVCAAGMVTAGTRHADDRARALDLAS